MRMVQKKGKKPDTNSQKKEVIKRLSQSKVFESRRRGSRFGGDSDRMDNPGQSVTFLEGHCLVSLPNPNNSAVVP